MANCSRGVSSCRVDGSGQLMLHCRAEIITVVTTADVVVGVSTVLEADGPSKSQPSLLSIARNPSLWLIVVSRHTCQT